MTELGVVQQARLYGPRDLRLEAHEAVAVRPEEVRVEVAYVGICGSELHLYHHPDWFGWVEPHCEGKVMGHEYTGVVVETGSSVDSIAVGTRVVCMNSSPCGRCRLCRAGRFHLCEDKVRPRAGGAWADSVVIPASFCLPLPEAVPLKDAALVEPIACCLPALDGLALDPTTTVLVIGGGPIGLLLATLSRKTGAGTVVVSEIRPERRLIAEQLGVQAVDPQTTDVEEFIRSTTEGLGADVVLEAVGSPATVELAVRCCAHGGVIVVAGVSAIDDAMHLKPAELFWRRLTITAAPDFRQATGNRVAFTRALAWLSEIDVDEIVTHEYPFEEIVAAIELATTGKCGKVMIRVQPEQEPALRVAEASS